VLATDGEGGTMWMTLSSLQYGGAFHTIRTTGQTYNAGPASATLSLLDGPNAGLLNDPTASNTAYLYAKAFGQFDISGGNTIYSYDPIANKVNSNILFVGTGGISIRGDPQTNTMIFDGQDLPFISSVPYSFSQFLVFSNAPTDTLVPSTFSSIKMQANGPSSIISFLGEDLITLNTDYANNRITFSLSTLTSDVVSTFLTRQRIIFSTYITKSDLSSFSTSYGAVNTLNALQSAICTMSTTIDNKIAYNSTIIGDVSVYSKGISSVNLDLQTFKRKYEIDQYLIELSTASDLLSTSANLQSSINYLLDNTNASFSTITASTIQTPLFWTSTLVTLVNSNVQPFVTPDASVSQLGATYFATYSSFYNIFADTFPFGSPIKPTIKTTTIDTTTLNATSNVSTLDGTIFSTMYALQGSFSFFPNNDPHNFKVAWQGNLSLNINGNEYVSPSVTYPRLGTFSNGLISSSISGTPICEASFTFIKINPTDYISFSNFTDLLEETQSYSVAPIYNAYGYNTQEAPLYTSIIPMNLPIGFSTMSNLVGSPYLELSTYVLIASTNYTSGCNTTFPISTTGYNSFTFYESATGNSAVKYTQDLSNGISSVITSNFSASNAFGYNFNSIMPSSAYTLQFVFGRQHSYENFNLSTLQKVNLLYDYAYTTFVSSLLYASTISSFNGEFIYLNAVNTNTSNLNTSNLNASSISSYSGTINKLLTSSIQANVGYISTLNTDIFTASSINANIMFVSTISSFNGSFLDIITSSIKANVGYISTVNTNLLIASSINVNTISVSSIDKVVTSSVEANVGNISIVNTNILTASSINANTMFISSISSYNGSILDLRASTIQATISYISTLNANSISVSSISSYEGNIVTLTVSSINRVQINSFLLNSTITAYINTVNSTINVNLSTFSTGTGNSTLASYINTINSTINVNLSSFSTGSGNSTLAAYINTVNSTINVNLSSFSTGSGNSTLAAYINTVNSTINVNLSSFSTGSGNSTLAAYINTVNSTINANLSTFSSVNAFLPGDNGSTISTIYTNMIFLTSTLEGNISTFSTTWIPPGEIYTSTLYTSSLFYGGLRQPFIQYGRSAITIGTPTILPLPYKDANYSIQLTYSNTAQPTAVLFASNVVSNQFYVTGNAGVNFYWTTFGNTF
jgi:hypothetical protein